MSVVILVGLIGLVTYEHFSRGTAPAAIEVQPHLADVRRNADAYYLPVEVANRGDLTARDVRIRLSLTPSGGEPQSSELLIDFLAGGATAHGTAVFRSDPSRGELRIDVLSYLDPS
ncbi:MAG: hypothetical protein ACRDJN_06120 [Chloroflexota bacterium]